jgi:hypothetical protein
MTSSPSFRKVKWQLSQPTVNWKRENYHSSVTDFSTCPTSVIKLCAASTNGLEQYLAIPAFCGCSNNSSIIQNIWKMGHSSILKFYLSK